MFKFFRQTRRKYIQKESLKKYLLYSVGEIVLVVLGILIALQINNWNDTNKNRRLEQEILAELKMELVNNKHQLDQLISDRNISRNVCEIVLPSFYRRKNVINDKDVNALLSNKPPNRIIFASALSSRLDSVIGSLPSYEVFYPRMGNIKSIIYSGKLNLVTNPQIRICIAEFEDRAKSVEMSTRGADKVMTEQIQPILRSYLKENGSYPLDEFFKNFDLRFFVMSYLGWTSAAIGTSRDFSETMQATIAAIEKELSTKDQ